MDLKLADAREQADNLLDGHRVPERLVPVVIGWIPADVRSEWLGGPGWRRRAALSVFGKDDGPVLVEGLERLCVDVFGLA
ncbi:MAG: hypothetical protein J2P45_31620, partial [Candidatus Dormibacteraeota bacterium]|nr:hypothetical protein [Candidatus Dormibacteraeota bacterium]